MEKWWGIYDIFGLLMPFLWKWTLITVSLFVLSLKSNNLGIKMMNYNCCQKNYHN